MHGNIPERTPLPFATAKPKNYLEFNAPWLHRFWGFPDGSVGKESTCNAGDTGDMVQSLGGGDPLEKEMATHCSILAWKIPWTEEPGGLQSTGSRRVRYN